MPFARATIATIFGSVDTTAVSRSVGIAYTAAVFGVVFVPGAVVLLKGRRWLFGVGLLVGGLVWWIAMFRLANPGSYWARLYGPEKTQRARERFPDAPTDPSVLDLMGAIALLIVPFAFATFVAITGG
jgi:hypothetical protein